MARKKVAGLDDNQVLMLKCPADRTVLDVTRFQTGPLDKMRGVHQMKHYGWIARCPSCGAEWGDFLDPMIAPSMWVLKDIVEAT
jgi:hypothetical protein